MIVDNHSFIYKRAFNWLVWGRHFPDFEKPEILWNYDLFEQLLSKRQNMEYLFEIVPEDMLEEAFRIYMFEWLDEHFPANFRAAWKRNPNGTLKILKEYAQHKNYDFKRTWLMFPDVIKETRSSDGELIELWRYYCKKKVKVSDLNFLHEIKTADIYVSWLIGEQINHTSLLLEQFRKNPVYFLKAMEVLLNIGNFIESEYLHHIFSMSHNNPHIEPEMDDSFLMGPFLNTVVELKNTKLKEKQSYPANVMMAVVLERALEINSDEIKVIPGAGQAIVPFSKDVSEKYIKLVRKYEQENNKFVHDLLYHYYMGIEENKTARCAGLFASRVVDLLSDGNTGLSGNDIIALLINGKFTEYAYSAGSHLDSLQLINYCSKTGINEKFISKMNSKKIPAGLIENCALITGKNAVNLLNKKAENLELNQGFIKSLAMGDIDTSSPCLIKAECIHCGMVNTVPFEKISFSRNNLGERDFPAILKNGSPCHFCEAPLVGVIYKNSPSAKELEGKMDFLEKEFGKENLEIMNVQTRENEFLLPENIERILRKNSRNKILQVSPQEFHDFITVLFAAENNFTIKMLLTIIYDKEPSFVSMEFLEILLKTGDKRTVKSILSSRSYLPFYTENSMAKYLTISNIAESLREMIKVGLLKIDGVELPDDPVQMLVSLNIIPPPTDRDDKCPCGSDRRYRNCCQRKKIWEYPISL